MDYGTWFGGNVEYIHCIQMLPFTPITEELLRKEWVEEEYPVVAEAYNRGDPPLSEEWKVFSFQDLYYGHVLYIYKIYPLNRLNHQGYT